MLRASMASSSESVIIASPFILAGRESPPASVQSERNRVLLGVGSGPASTVLPSPVNQASRHNPSISSARGGAIPFGRLTPATWHRTCRGIAGPHDLARMSPRIATRSIAVNLNGCWWGSNPRPAELPSVTVLHRAAEATEGRHSLPTDPTAPNTCPCGRLCQVHYRPILEVQARMVLPSYSGGSGLTKLPLRALNRRASGGHKPWRPLSAVLVGTPFARLTLQPA